MIVADTNDIPTRQNTPDVVECQAAVQILYRRAELLFYLRFAVGVIIPVLIAIANLVLQTLSLAANLDKAAFAAWGALYGLTIMLLDELVLDELQQRWKRCAATAQEMFDTTLFGLPWRTTKVGARLEVSDVHSWAKQWRRIDPSFERVLDWYPPVVRCVPAHLGTVLCQRTNLVWDSRLRRRYAFVLGAFATGLAILALSVLKYLGLDVDGLLLAISTLAPAFRWAIRERKRQLAAASTLDRLCTRARELQDDIVAHLVDVVDAKPQSRELQDDIFDYRRTAPIGLSWVFRIHRSDDESALQTFVKRSVQEYRERHGLAPCEGPL